jgi:3-hydroxyisobutyrate dehydrogenase
MKSEHLSPTELRVGIVGLGRMGANMARRLSESGVAVTALYDRDSERASELATEIKSHAAKSLTEVTSLADCILTVITDDAAMRTIFATSGDSLLRDAQDRIFLQCATLSPSLHQELAAPIAAAGARALETCMAGSITQARSGSIFFICGGDQAIFQHVQPLLEKLGAPHFVGNIGQAAQVKALVNMLMNINTAALAEALGLGEALGLDLTVLTDIFSQTGANSRVLVTDGADMIAREHEVYFSAAHAAKDSGIALEMARAVDLDVPLAAVTKARYDKVVELGFGESDKSVIAELSFRDRAATKARA